MSKSVRKSVRFSDTDLEYAEELIKRNPELNDISSLVRFLLYDYKEKEGHENLEKEINKLSKEQELSRETFNIYLEYLASAGEGIDSEALHKEAVKRIEKRKIKTRTNYFSSKKI